MLSYLPGSRGSIFAGLWVLVGSLLTGCGGKDRPVPVEGVVTLDGQPVAGATVAFYPKVGGQRPAAGVTDSNGVFHLTSLRPGDGALPGEYQVIVIKADADPAAQYVDPTDPEAEKKYLAAKKSSKSGKPPAGLIPPAYGSIARTPLSVTVPADGRVVLALTSNGS